MNKRLGVLMAMIGLFVALAVPGLGEEPKPLATFTAFAVSMSSGGAGVVEIAITRWSTDAERQGLIDVLKQKGSPAAVDALQKLPQVGYIKSPESLGDALFFARSNPQPDGSTQIVIATDRPMSFAGLRAPGAASKYDATIIELRIQKDGKGEGKIVLAGKASFDEKTGKVGISNYQGEPVRLMQVKEKQP